ncbi:hypothetical protein ACQ1Q5_00115 [Ornithobacterium rhinotracheale]
MLTIYKKIYLLAVFQFESEEINFKKNAVATISLSLETPIILSYGKKTLKIGTKEEYLYRRLAIQQALRRVKTSAKYNNGGKGRKEKMKVIEQFTNKEYNYIQTKLHKYTRDVINFCLKNRIGKIIIKDQSDEINLYKAEIKSIEDNENLSKKEKRELINSKKFLLRNWSYNGLMQFLLYKAKMYNIEIEDLSSNEEIE